MKLRVLLCAVLAGLVWCSLAKANGVAAVVAVDEHGNGYWVPPGGAAIPLLQIPSGLGTAGAKSSGFGAAGEPLSGFGVSYLLPFPVAPGQLLIFEPGTPNLSDIIVFVENRLTFISDGTDGVDAPADVPIPLEALQPSLPFAGLVATTVEIGPEGNNYALYNPLGAMPGSMVGTAPIAVDYTFVSDGTIPLPSAVGMGAVGLGLITVRRNVKRAA